jgi:hypothetical protein
MTRTVFALAFILAGLLNAGAAPGQASAASSAVAQSAATQSPAQSSAAQTPSTPVPPELIGTWTLVSTEEGVDGAQPWRVPNPRGLLVLDGAGLVFEAITRENRQRPTPALASLSEAQLLFATYAGFWGRYRANTQQKTLTLQPEGGLSPSVMGREIGRSYDFAHDRLVVTSKPGEPHVRGVTRWTWERVPPVDGLSPSYRAVVGFWQHVVESRANLSLGTSTADVRRAPSIIVYSPSGYVGVHFPPLNRKPFAAAEPTDEEARAARQGYVGYFGALGVYPGQVFHQVLAGVSPAQGTTLKRFASIVGDEAHLRFPVVINNLGQQTTTYVTMKRLSGVADMLGAAAGH